MADGSFEDLVCAAAPYNAKELMPNHAGLAALVAGFALTAFILLLDRGHEPIQQSGSNGSTTMNDDNEERQRTQANASLLLILAAIVGLVAAYLFSSFTGDHCMNTQLQFHYPSALLVISATLMVSGLGVAAASIQRFNVVAGVIRATVFLAACLMILRIAADLRYAATIVERLNHWGLTTPSAVGAGGSTGYAERLSALTEEVGGTPGSDYAASYVAAELFNEGSDRSVSSGMTVVALWFVLATGLVWRQMRPLMDERRPLAPRALRGELRWRLQLTVATLATTTVIVVMASIQGLGEDVATPSSLDWIVLLFGTVSVMALATQPPVARSQVSVGRWMRTVDLRARLPTLGRRPGSATAAELPHGGQLTHEP